MSRPACMTEAEWTDWHRPFTVYQEADGDRVSHLRPPTGHPCYDCPATFHAEQRAAGLCDGKPRPGGTRRPLFTADVALERRRAQWREYRRRRRAAA